MQHKFAVRAGEPQFIGGANPRGHDSQVEFAAGRLQPGPHGGRPAHEKQLA
ncbi:hypothetical protein [Syntrophomonas palmitatica]|uniref:hypothetical protein n=1 Tax=Syntrophomonas palmitatica TaxID=402877 RepID=UPI0012ED1C1D|nr:hypothetical protein [Syntrophomonas palmitatica]